MTSLKDVIVKDRDILGEPLCSEERVCPLQALFDSIEGGETPVGQVVNPRDFLEHS